jgi:hypothetical protein
LQAQQAAAAEIRNKELDQCRAWEKSRTASKEQKAYAQQMLRGAAQDTQEPSNISLQAFYRVRQQHMEGKIQERCRELAAAGVGGAEGQPVPVVRVRVSEVLPASGNAVTSGTGVTSDMGVESRGGVSEDAARPGLNDGRNGAAAVACGPIHNVLSSGSGRWGGSSGCHALVKVWRPPEDLREVTEGGIWLVVGLQAHGTSGDCGPGGRLLELQSSRHTR